MTRVDKIFKEKEYRKQFVSNFKEVSSASPINLGGLKNDFGNVLVAVKSFPFKSALSVLGFLTLLYIGFKISKKFVNIKSRLTNAK